MHTRLLQRKRCQVRARPQENACGYGARVSGETHYNYFRSYDTETGRYSQPDPIGLDGGWNRVGYAQSNSLSLVDPEGLNTRAAPSTPSYSQPILNMQATNLIREIRTYQPGFTYPLMSAPGAGFNASNVSTLQSTLQMLQRMKTCPVNNVITETMAGRGRVDSQTTLTQDQLLDAGARFLGPNYRELGKNGSGVFRSSDGVRQFRIDENSIQGNHSPGVPHGHLELFRPGIPRPIVNNHIPFK